MIGKSSQSSPTLPNVYAIWYSISPAARPSQFDPPRHPPHIDYNNQAIISHRLKPAAKILPLHSLPGQSDVRGRYAWPELVCGSPKFELKR